MNSGEFRWIPVNSGEFRWIPVNSGEFRWIPVNSGEFRFLVNWIPVILNSGKNWVYVYCKCNINVKCFLKNCRKKLNLALRSAIACSAEISEEDRERLLARPRTYARSLNINNSLYKWCSSMHASVKACWALKIWWKMLGCILRGDERSPAALNSSCTMFCHSTVWRECW